MNTLLSQPTKAPTRKVAAGAIGSGVVGVPLAGVLVGVAYSAGIELPAGTEAALGAFISAVLGVIASYFTRERG